MTRLLLVYLTFILSISITACKEDWQEALAKVDRLTIYSNDPKNWRLVRMNKQNEWVTDFIVEKTEGDTSKVLLFLRTRNDSVIVYQYKKRFPCAEADTCYLEMIGKDTLFFYRQSFGAKKFEVGEYAYRFGSGQMSSSERKYYLNHEDSLRRLKGNGLPPLPIED